MSGADEIKLYMERSKKYEDQALVLDSIRKSGTHYLQILITNYLCLYFGERTSRVSYDEVKDVFPNHRDFLLFPEKYKDLSVQQEHVPISEGHVIKKVGFSDFIYGHDDFSFLPFSSAKKIIHLFRNPLDMAVSYYYFAYKNRPSLARQGLGKLDLAVSHLMKYYIPHYLFMREFSHKSDKVLRIPYESLFGSTYDTLSILFQWLRFPVSVKTMTKAIDYSSIRKARMEEEETGKSVVISRETEFTGSFIRSGKIGQWKSHFDKSELNVIVRLLEKNGIYMDEFTVE